MKFTRTVVEAFGVELAPVVVSTDELEDRLAPALQSLRISRGQLAALTGIDERRWWEPGYPVSAAAAAAGLKALRDAGVSAADVGMLVYGGVCREDFEPATACDVAALMARAGAEMPTSVVIHDVANACLGVLTGIIDVANRIELGQIRAGLVVSAETAREINDVAIARLNAEPTAQGFAESVATFTGGSGAIGVLLTDGSFGVNDRRRLRGGAVLASPRHHRLCRWGVEPVDPADADPLRALRPYARTDAGAVLEHGVELGERTWAAFLDEVGWSADQIDRTVCHQIGSVHRKTMLGKLGIELNRDFSTVEYLGNTGTVALPMATALAHQRGFLEPGHRVGLLGIGSGLNCMMLGVDW